MRVVIQRVSRASVRVESRVAGEIGAGVLVLLGVAEDDGDAEADRLAGKVARLRIFENLEGRFDRSLLDTGGAVLVVSQFTLIAIAGVRRELGWTSRRRRVPRSPSRCTSGSALLCANSEYPFRPASSAPGCRCRSSTTVL